MLKWKKHGFTSNKHFSTIEELIQLDKNGHCWRVMTKYNEMLKFEIDRLKARCEYSKIDVTDSLTLFTIVTMFSNSIFNDKPFKSFCFIAKNPKQNNTKSIFRYGARFYNKRGNVIRIFFHQLKNKPLEISVLVPSTNFNHKSQIENSSELFSFLSKLENTYLKEFNEMGDFDPSNVLEKKMDGFSDEDWAMIYKN